MTPEEGFIFEFEVGEIVFDDLTGKNATVIGVSYQNGRKGPEDLNNCLHAVGYWVDNDWVGGGRHPWEIRKIKR